jgi:hypothetical protein
LYKQNALEQSRSKQTYAVTVAVTTTVATAVAVVVTTVAAKDWCREEHECEEDGRENRAVELHV